MNRMRFTAILACLLAVLLAAGVIVLVRQMYFGPTRSRPCTRLR